MGFKGPARKSRIGLTAAALFAVTPLPDLVPRSANVLPVTSPSGAAHRTYTTNFPLAENPISEGRNWINGRTAGLDWANIRTTSGFAFGTESGRVKYDDSTALLTGTWGPNQAVQATVRSLNQNDGVYEEVELRLRSSLSAHHCTGYEVNFRCSKTGNAYTEIVRWNGPLGSFTYLNRGRGSKYGAANGDVVKATMIGNLITVYINDVPVLQATDNVYQTGSPGMGFYLEGRADLGSDYGFTSFTATDGLTVEAAAWLTNTAATGEWRRRPARPLYLLERPWDTQFGPENIASGPACLPERNLARKPSALEQRAPNALSAVASGGLARPGVHGVHHDLAAQRSHPSARHPPDRRPAGSE